MPIHDKHIHEQPIHDFDGITENRENQPPIYFKVLLYGLVAWGIVFSAYYLLSGWSSEKEFQQQMASYRERTQKPQPPSGPGAPAAGMAVEPAQGKDLYAKLCAACHGTEGKGGIGPDLTRTDLKYGRSDNAVKESIRNGRPGGMPAFGNQLSAGEIEGLTSFVLNLK